MHMNLKVLVLLFTFTLYTLTFTPVYAQQVTSDPLVITKVGSPQGKPPGGGSTELLQAAADLYNAYKICTSEPPPTYDSLRQSEGKDVSDKKTCLMNNLKSKYSSTIGGFDKRYKPGILPRGCVQCTGFVALSITLLSGKDDALGGGDAASFYNLDEIKSGNIIFTRFTPNSSSTIKEGDIGVAPSNPGKEGIGAAGHLLIVKKFDPDSPALFTGIESSFPNICYLNQTYSQHHVETYHFFRKKVG